MSLINNQEYIHWFHSIKNQIKNTQIKAALKVNNELILLYYHLGKQIVEKQSQEQWGNGIIEQLSKDLKSAFSDINGFSKSNLYAMRQFYLVFSNFHQVGGKLEDIPYIVKNICVNIPWRHLVLMLQKIKQQDEFIFYLMQTIENNWSRNILQLQIESNLYQRKGKAVHNFKEVLPLPEADLLNETLKNPYNFDFLTLEKNALEKDIEKGLINNITHFILELGKGFAFLGKQHKVSYQQKEYFIDLLFYNVNLHCYVVIELKVGDFMPEYVGKLNFYLNLIDATLKKEMDKPTIGILLCKTSEKFEIEFALKDINKPIGVSEYRFNELPTDIKSEMPSLEELEFELKKLQQNEQQ
jgi:predicted nuclease of restriction endonuclease-like (RecB) superfamily